MDIDEETFILHILNSTQQSETTDGSTTQYQCVGIHFGKQHMCL